MVTRWAFLAVLAAQGCVSAEGDVLTSLDGGVDPSECAVDGPCPLPPAGEVTVCGRVLDIETSQPIVADGPTVRVFDLVDLLANPGTVVAAAEVEPDACGWFHTTTGDAIGISVVQTGELVGGAFRRVATSLVTPAGQAVRVNAFALRAETDERWSQDAGLPANMSFADGGAAMAIFVDVSSEPIGPFQGAPVAGVSLRLGGLPAPGQDFYVTGVDPLVRAGVDPALTATGATGAGLLADPGAGLIIVGGQHADCSFDGINGLSLPGTVLVQELVGTCN